MGGLIQAAKEKIWSIATTMAQAEPALDLRPMRTVLSAHQPISSPVEGLGHGSAHCIQVFVQRCRPGSGIGEALKSSLMDFYLQLAQEPV